MAGKQMSYDYVNQKRDLSDAFVAVIKADPILAALVGTSGQATNTKHEWLEDVVEQKVWSIGGAYTAGDGTIVTADNTGVKVDDILQFEHPTGATGTLYAKVTALPNATDVDIAIYGGSTDENMAVGSIVKLNARARNEGTEAGADNGTEPTTEYNVTQIFDRTAKVSNTSIQIDKYGIGGALNYQVQHQLNNLKYELTNSLLNGLRVPRSATENGTFGGIMFFLNNATGNKVNAGGAPIDSTLLNDALELGNKNGATGDLTILCAPNQARRVSAFNTAAGTSLNQIVQRAETTAGSYVTRFVGDLGNVTNIVVDRNFNKDKIVIMDPSKIQLMPLKGRGFSDVDATPNGADFTARRILGELTLEVKNASTHIVIEDVQI